MSHDCLPGLDGCERYIYASPWHPTVATTSHLPTSQPQPTMVLFNAPFAPNPGPADRPWPIWPTPSCPCYKTMPYPHHDPHNHPLSTEAVAAEAERRSRQTLHDELIEDLAEDLESESRKAVFTCGGRIPIVLTPNRDRSGKLTPRTDGKVQEQRMVTKGVSVRWGGDGEGRVVSLPATDHAGDAALQQLIEDCQPATFGRKGKDVFDESYRRAGAMATENFMTGFCPYETGIIDIVTQLLLPPIVGDLRDLSGHPTPNGRVETTAEDHARISHAIECETKPATSVWDDPELIALAKSAVCVSMPVEYLVNCLVSLDLPTLTEAEIRRLMASPRPEWRGTVTPSAAYEFLRERLIAQRRTQRTQAESQGSGDLGAVARRRRMLSRGIRAELYKLNVYSGPSGMFKAHVDTPRADTQIGSLVVCLPAPFDGGALAVRHEGQEVVHDWAADSNVEEPAIQWAAFYSDCEHEVLEVTAGHRVTLTYNLYLAAGTGLLAGRALTLQPTELPLHHRLQHMLKTAGFLPEGGYLGFHLTHRYPHTHPVLHDFVPNMLKGSDLALYEAVHGLGLTSILTPIRGKSLPEPNVLDELDQIHDREENHTESHGPMNEYAPPSLLRPLETETYDDGDEASLSDEEEIEEDHDAYDTEAEEDEEEPIYTERTQRMVDQVKARDRITWVGKREGHEELCKALLAVSVPIFVAVCQRYYLRC